MPTIALDAVTARQLLKIASAGTPAGQAGYLGADAHRRLYSDLPQVACYDGCQECCGAVWWSEWELAQLTADERAKLAEQERVTRCVFAVDGRCEVYDRRPFACRVYGAVEGLPCGDGATCPAGPLPLREADRRRAVYLRQALRRSGALDEGGKDGRDTR